MEEWEIEATMDGKKWIVSAAGLPAATRDIAQFMCDEWHESRPHITYRPIGYTVIRTKIKDKR